MRPEIFRPSPVSVTMPTMMPAVAVVAETPRIAGARRSRALSSAAVASAPSRDRTKLRAAASIVAKNTARNADNPMTISTAIAASE